MYWWLGQQFVMRYSEITWLYVMSGAVNKCKHMEVLNGFAIWKDILQKDDGNKLQCVQSIDIQFNYPPDGMVHNWERTDTFNKQSAILKSPTNMCVSQTQ